jgi:hypothetical protein
MLFRGRLFCHISINSGIRASVDHVIPRSKDGRTVHENLRLAHRFCNVKRGNQEKDEHFAKWCKGMIIGAYGELLPELICQAAARRMTKEGAEW